MQQQQSQKNPLAARFESHFSLSQARKKDLTEKGMNELKSYINDHHHYCDLIKTSNADALTKHLFIYCLSRENDQVKEIMEKKEKSLLVSIFFTPLFRAFSGLSYLFNSLRYVDLSGPLYSGLIFDQEKYQEKFNESVFGPRSAVLLSSFIFYSLSAKAFLKIGEKQDAIEKRLMKKTRGSYDQIAARAFKFPKKDVESHFCQTFKNKFLREASNIDRIINAGVEKSGPSLDYRVLKVMQDCIREAVCDAEKYSQQKYHLFGKILGAGGENLDLNI